jgi:cyclomaltodextrinase / maltogenic alpha-amylase / neopullulanase
MNALALLAALLLRPQAVDHEFVYRATAEHSRVNLAGTFNDWNKDAWPMQADADGRTWRRKARLEPGKHLYKFVLDGETWITDPLAKRNEDDGGGNINSVLILLPKGYEEPAKVGDGKLTTSTLKHEQEAPYVNWDKGMLELQLKCRPDDAERVELWANGKLHRMREVARQEMAATYSAQVPWDRKADFQYLFTLWDKRAGINFGEGGPSMDREVVPFRLLAKEFRPITVPGWVETTVLYQIFPDRFENGSKANDPENVVAWDAEPKYFNFFGGDLAGVAKRLPYLKALGIGAIYFNPIFASPNNHGYETIDYHKIEPRFGTNAEFAQLTRTLDQNRIRVILDGVFNHSATTFEPFQDLVRNGPDSKYKEWFYPKSFPIEVRENPPYEAWYGFPSMPKVNLLHPEAAAYMLRVPKFWHERATVAGWRLDVANEVPMPFWREFRKAVKSLGQDKWILGEHWGDSSPWLKGDQWDASMNYPWRDAVLQYVASGTITGQEFLRRLMANYRMYVPQVSRNQMNPLGTHDTPRFRTLCGGDAKLAMLGASIQFASVGVPSIYYGDELGMEGGRDPDNRRGMRWDLATDKNPFLTHYRKLVQARRQSRALQSGEPVPLMAQGKAMAFARVLGGEVAVLAANRSDQAVQLTLPLKGKLTISPALVRQGWEDVLGGGHVKLTPSGTALIRLEPKSAALLVPGPRSQALLGGAPDLRSWRGPNLRGTFALIPCLDRRQHATEA